jgi:hypothetical protein
MLVIIQSRFIGVYPLGEDIPLYRSPNLVVAQVLQVLRVRQALQALQRLQSLQSLQVLQALPFYRLLYSRNN